MKELKRLTTGERLIASGGMRDKLGETNAPFLPGKTACPLLTHAGVNVVAP